MGHVQVANLTSSQSPSQSLPLFAHMLSRECVTCVAEESRSSLFSCSFAPVGKFKVRETISM